MLLVGFLPSIFAAICGSVGEGSLNYCFMSGFCFPSVSKPVNKTQVELFSISCAFLFLRLPCQESCTRRIAGSCSDFSHMFRCLDCCVLNTRMKFDVWNMQLEVFGFLFACKSEKKRRRGEVLSFNLLFSVIFLCWIVILVGF